MPPDADKCTCTVAISKGFIFLDSWINKKKKISLIDMSHCHHKFLTHIWSWGVHVSKKHIFSLTGQSVEFVIELSI